jgi:type III secretion system YopN/LcrE/InvE/MxiC family regulator
MLGALPPAWRDAVDAVQPASRYASAADVPAISLTDAAEEMAQFFSQARLQDRSLKERDLLPYESPALRRVEEIEALIQVIWAGSKNQGDAQQRASQLLASAGSPTELDRLLKQTHGSTEQFLLLSKALAQGSVQDGRGDPALEALRDRVDALWVRDGVRIRADINVSQGLAGTEVASDRQAYHDAVLDGGTLPRTLALLLARYGDDVEAAVERLRRALGIDIGSPRPSLPPERLRAILHELFVLGALLPFLKNCRDLGRRARLQRRKDRRQRTASTAAEDEGATLLGELAEWVPRWLTQGDVRSLLYQYGLSLEQQPAGSDEGATSSPAGESVAAMSESDRLFVVLHGIRSVLRQVPDRLFPDQDHKLNVDQVLVGVLDSLMLGAADEPPKFPS